ncbi:MAG: PAS domain-containing protein, partial [Planctomycetota bacterium]
MHHLQTELYRRLAEDSSIFEFLESGSLDGIWYWDLEKPEDEWMSARFWETLGYDPATKAHSPSAWHGIIHPDDLDVATRNFHEHCANPKHPYDQTVRYTHRDGSTVWIRCRGLVIRDASGKPIRMLGAHTDVTQLKVGSEFRGLYEHSPDMYASVDPSDRSITQCNQTLARKTGYRKEEILGQPIYFLYHPDCHAEVDKVFRSFVATGHVDNAELEVRKRDGTKIPVLLNAEAVRGDDGCISHSNSCWRDISELKELERELSDVKQEKERELQESFEKLHRVNAHNAELEEFAHIASHDLRAPLRAISQVVSWIQEDESEQLSSEGQEQLAMVEQRVHRMGKLLDDLLAYSRVGTRRSEPEMVDTARLVEEVVSLLAVPDGFRIVLSGDMPVFETSRTPLRLVFLNLITNALKHHDSNSGTIEIETRDDDEHFEFRIADDGPGIDP